MTSRLVWPCSNWVLVFQEQAALLVLPPGPRYVALEERKLVPDPKIWLVAQSESEHNRQHARSWSPPWQRISLVCLRTLRSDNDQTED